jgi:hypothetical protein
MKARSASAIYRKAAEWMDKQPVARLMAFACLKVAPNDYHPDRLRHIEKILGDCYIDQHCFDVNAGVLALLLMSEIAKDEQ